MTTPARTLRLTSCLVLAVAAVVLGGLSVHRKVAAFQPVGFQGGPSGGLTRVDRVLDRGTGLAPGDLILLVDGSEAAGDLALGSRLRSRPESELAVLRGGQVVRLQYHRPPLAPDYSYLILALIGGAYLLIGLFTLIRQRGAEGFLFCLWCMTSALLYLLTPVPPLDFEFRLVFAGDQLARIFLPPLTLHLLLIFPSPLPAVSTRRRRAVAFLYLPAAVLLALQLDLMLANGRFLFGRPSESALRALDSVELIHLVGYALLAVAILVYRLLRDPGWEQRRQLHWVVFGVAGGYLPFFLLYVVPWVLQLPLPELLRAIAVLPLALVPLCFAYAILRYKLWDIEVIARDIVSGTLTLLLGVIGFSLVNLAITRGISQELALVRNLLSFAAGLGIAGLLVPTRNSLSAALERLQYRGTFGKRRALLGLGRDLLHERDLGRLCTSLLDRLESGMDLERANLYLAQGEQLFAAHHEELLPEATWAQTPVPAGTSSSSLGGFELPLGPTMPLAPPALLAESPAARFLPRSLPLRAFSAEFWRANVVRLDGVRLPGEPASPLQRLFIAGYRYAFPLTVRGREVGLVLASHKRELVPLNSEDLELIRHLLNQAALAIENAQLVGQLHVQLEEVQRLQSYSHGIFESSPGGIAVLDRGHRVLSANPAFAALVGRPRESLIGSPIAAVLPVAPLPPPGEAPLEVSFCDSSGKERYLQLSLAEFAAASGTPGAAREPLFILLAHDVSERVTMENALKEKERLAALGMLAAGVAHEVNTPITGISSYAQMLLAETPESDPRYSILKKVERQTFRAARIVNNLLEFARNRQSERRPLAIEPLLHECVDLLAERLEHRPIELCWDTPQRPPAAAGGGGDRDRARTAEPILVMGSDGELQQVFTNLLGNALDAMANLERGRLGIGLHATETTVVVRIEDSGPGIPPEKIDTIFQPFFSTKLHRGGTGLGLAISHDIVKRHGGRVRVESAPGNGACFEVELPRHRPAAAGAL
ncbi:MAG TPA: ATP-binding protein [Thermoanaerobaculia bacterium]|nr:ATP-binding protein [Thermoanaerobaculia bacterium]